MEVTETNQAPVGQFVSTNQRCDLYTGSTPPPASAPTGDFGGTNFRPPGKNCAKV